MTNAGIGLVAFLAAMSLGCSGEKETEVPEPPSTLRLDSRLENRLHIFSGAAAVWSERFPSCKIAVQGWVEVVNPDDHKNAVLLDPALTAAQSGDIAAAKWSYMQNSMIIGSAALSLTEDELSAVALHELVHARGVGHLPEGLMTEYLQDDQPTIIDAKTALAVCDSAPKCCEW